MFTQFKALVENQQNRKIKGLRSDNRTEYTNERFQNIVIELGINHTLTNTAKPEQKWCVRTS